MSSIQVGDFVRDIQGSFTRVYGFHHKDAGMVAEYIQIFFKDSNRPLEISAFHMVIGMAGPIAASKVAVGDILGDQKVTLIKTVQRRGVYSPLTETGDLMVSGIPASNYVDTIGLLPAALQASLAHSLLASRRLFCQWDFDDCVNESYTGGKPNWLLLCLKCLEVLSKQCWAVRALVLFAGLPVIVLIYQPFITSAMVFLTYKVLVNQQMGWNQYCGKLKIGLCSEDNN